MTIRKVWLLVVLASVVGLCHAQIIDNLNPFVSAAETQDVAGMSTDFKTPNLTVSTVSNPQDDLGKKKVLYINSYHKGYVWSDGVENGLLRALDITENSDGSLSTQDSPVELKILRMNTKNNHLEEFINQVVLDARKVISEWQPDVVVASDDNASKYLISKYYTGSSIPFVFCGVNADPKSYGFGNNNVTGMTEKGFFVEVIKLLRPFAKGARIGYIGSDTLTERSVVDTLAKENSIVFTESKLVSTFSEWKEAYKHLQDSVDIVFWLSPIGIQGWNEQEAIDFVRLYTKVPSGSTINSAISCALVTQMKIAEEQGWWAGKTALKILSGVSPADIPIVSNKQSRLYLNMELAKILGIVFPMELIERSIFLAEEKQ